MAENEGGVVFIGRGIPTWILEKYIPTGEIRAPEKGDYFWSDIKGQVVVSIGGDSAGGPRVILSWRGENASEMSNVRPGVQGVPTQLRIVKEIPGTEKGPDLPEVPPEAPEAG